MSDDILDALDEERPDTWKADDHGGEGATIIGTFIGWQEGATEKYGMKDIAIIQEGPKDSAGCKCGLHQDGQVWRLWMLSTVLIGEWAQVSPKIGERVGARFLGKVSNPQGNDYQKWRVEVAGRKGSSHPKHMDGEIAQVEAEAEETRVMQEQVTHLESSWPETQESAAAVRTPTPTTEDPFEVDKPMKPETNDSLPIAKIQLRALHKLAPKVGVPVDPDWENLTREEAAELIAEMQE